MISTKSNPLESGNRTATEQSPAVSAAPARLIDLDAPESTDTNTTKPESSTEAIRTTSELIMAAETGSFEMNSTEQAALCHFFNISNPSPDDMFFLLLFRSRGLSEAIRLAKSMHDGRSDRAIIAVQRLSEQGLRREYRLRQ